MMNGKSAIWKKKIVWNIRLGELLFFLAFHLLVGFSYWIALWITVERVQPLILATETALSFAIKLIFLIPVYWFIFWQLRNRSLQTRLLVHIVTMPLYVICWVKTSYYLLDLKIVDKLAHLPWPFSFWDYFIGSLMYLVQFAVLHIYENYVQMQKQQQKEKELLKLAHQGEMNVLKAQIQPHFLFNTLNSISASVPSDLEHTRELIAKLADTFRFALNASANEMIPLRDELAFTKAYLELEKERFHDRLSVHYDVDPYILDMKVPPMILQPIVENSLKHGIAKSLDGGHINITIRRTDGLAHFEIADTGAGLRGISKESVMTKGMGLQNTNQRLQKLYGTSIRLIENMPGGVRVLFDIPSTKNLTSA